MIRPCPSCQELVDAAVYMECPNCGWRFDQATQITAAAPRKQLKIPIEVELACTVDRTGSSEQFAKGIRESLPMILDQVLAKARGLRVWLQSHGDEDCGQQPVLLTDGGDAKQAVADVQTIVYGGGGDPPEHHLTAFEHLLQLVPWTANPLQARGALLGFLTADSKPARSGKTATQLGECIRQQGLLFYLICEPTPQLSALCRAACGLLFPITNDPDPGDLQRIAAQVAASVVYTAAKGGTVPLTAPAA